MTTESEWDQNRTAKVRAPEDPQRTEAARTGRLPKAPNSIKSFSDSVSDTEQQQAFLRGLKIDPGAMHTVKAEKETRFGNTCEWILTRDAYRNWNTGTGSQVLVIAAPPGQGKSVLAKYLLETFSKIPEKHVVLDYFCQGSPGRNTALSVAQSLLYQLLTTRPQLFKYVPQQHTRSTDRAPELPFDTMWKILADLLKSAETGDVYCVIDGIDECERESQEILCNAIEKSFTPQSNSEAPSGNYIRFLLTSRPTTPATRLGHLSNLYEIQNSDVDPDITEYIKFHVQKMTRARMLPIQLSYIVTSLLSSQAEGMFLLVSLNLTELDQSRGNLSFYALLQKLEEIPKNVQEVYAEAIKQIQQNPGYRDLAKTILDVLLVCHDPLTVDSFGIACYDWPQSCTSHSELENSVVMNFEYPSKTACSSLIRFVEGTIQFCHPTARQYLLTPQSNLGSFSFDLAECHLYMARLCLRYLLLDDLRITKSEQEASGVEDPGKAFPLLEYALRNWSHHLRQSKHILERYPELLKSFFDPQSERFRHILSPWAYFQNFPKVYGSGDVLVLHALVFFELTDMILHTKLLNPESTQRQAFCQTEFFLELKTGVDGRNADSDTPLILATGRSSLAVVRTLLQLGADPDAVNEDGNTALHLAAGSSGLKDDLDILKLLMSVTKFPEARNKKGYPPFLLVADEQVAEALLDCGVDVDCERDGDKTTLLEIAGEEGRVELAKLLILRGADVNHLDSTHWNPLCAAVRGGNTEIVKLLIGKKARVFSDSEYGWSPLHAAAAAGSSEAIRALLDYGVDVNIQTLNKRTALYVATFDGQLEAVETLLQAKANVMLPDEDGNTPLHVAAENGKELIVQELINANADVNSVSGDFSTPLTYACKGNHLSTVQLLLNKGANVNFTHPSTIPMLQLAIFSGYTDVANLLIASGINIESTYKSKFTPLYVAAWKNQPEIAKVLLLRGAAHQCFGDSNKSALHHFAEHGHVDLVEQLLEDVDQNIQTDEGWTPLHYAADSGHLAVVRQILRAKADLRARTSHGFTALILSCMKGRFDVVEYLLGKGANPNDFSHNGLSSVAAAALNGHLEILNLLLERGASASAKSENGLTALFTAAQGGHLEVVNRLLDLGVEIDALYGPGLWPPLFVAAQEGHFAIVEKLLDSQSNPSYVAKSGTTLLHLVVGKGGAQVTKRLVREGADITGLNRANSQPLLIACLDGDPGVVDTLIKHGANVNHANRFGQTAMHAAASKGHLPIVDRLLKAQADPNFRDFEGWAPIMFASCRGHAQIVERLLETNIDPNMESNLFTTPLHLATYHHWESTIKVLLKAGADPCILDSYGQSSLEWAHLHGDTFEIMKDWHKHYEETSEQIKRDRLQSSVALVSQRALTRQSEPRSDTYYLFNDLGIFLYRLGNFADAYVGFEQSIVDRDSHLHGMSCSWCDVEEVKGKRFTCKTCAETSLCNPCMDKYREEDTGFRGCRGHDFLEIPRPEWDSFPPEAVNEKDETLGKWLERIAEKYKFAASEHQQSASSGADLLESPRADACPSTTVTSLAPIMEVDLHSAVEIHTESRTEAEAGSSVNARMVQEPTLSDPTKEVTPSARSEDTRLAKAEGKPSFTAVDTSASIVTQQHALPADEQAYPVNEGGPAPSTDDARKASADGGLVADSDHRDCMDAGAAVIPPTNGHAESDQGETAKFDTVLGS